MIVYKK